MAILLITVVSPFAVSATVVEDRFIQLESARPSDSGMHRVGFTITDFGTDIGSIWLEYCQNDPIVGAACVPPTGFDATAVTILSQVGETGFSIHANSDANNIILTRTAATPTQADLVYELDDIINPSYTGTFYTRIRTLQSEDATGPYIQAGGIALSTSPEIDLETEVPPYLTFCSGVTIVGLDCSTANNFFINLGEFSEFSTTTATSQMLAATNAANGYTIRANGTTLTSGNNTIPALSVQATSQVGVSQFGMNLRNNANPNVGANTVGPGTASPRPNYNNPDQFRYVNNDAVAGSPVATDTRKFTASYIANISSDQAPGVYATTISYIALANF
jgi:hypothetical protein